MLTGYTVGSVPMGSYLILQVSFGRSLAEKEVLSLTLCQQVNIPLQIQPQIFGFFSLVGWGQILYYNQ